MREKRWFAVFAAALGMLALLAVVWACIWMLGSRTEAQPAPAPAYLLRDNGGKVALYTAEGEGPIAQYDIYTRLLPQADVLALQQGVPVQDEAALQRLLEDYGM